MQAHVPVPLRTLFLDTHDVARLIGILGLPACLRGLAGTLRTDYLRWPDFDKAARIAAYSEQGTIELMPITDGTHYSFKCVNGHPGNGRRGLPTVMAMGALLDCDTGMIRLLGELTLTTALRTAAMSALAAQVLARRDSHSMALIGNGAQSDFQALAFACLLGIRDLRLYDVDRGASERLARNLAGAELPGRPLSVRICDSAAQAVRGADIVTTVTAFQGRARVLDAHLVEPGMHLNAVGGRLSRQDRTGSRYPAPCRCLRRVSASDPQGGRDPADAGRFSRDRAVARPGGRCAGADADGTGDLVRLGRLRAGGLFRTAFSSGPG